MALACRQASSVCVWVHDASVPCPRLARHGEGDDGGCSLSCATGICARCSLAAQWLQGRTHVDQLSSMLVHDVAPCLPTPANTAQPPADQHQMASLITPATCSNRTSYHLGHGIVNGCMCTSLSPCPNLASPHHHSPKSLQPSAAKLLLWVQSVRVPGEEADTTLQPRPKSADLGLLAHEGPGAPPGHRHSLSASASPREAALPPRHSMFARLSRSVSGPERGRPGGLWPRSPAQSVRW